MCILVFPTFAALQLPISFVYLLYPPLFLEYILESTLNGWKYFGSSFILSYTWKKIFFRPFYVLNIPLFRICFVFQFGFSFLSRVIIISGVVDRLRSPRLHRYGRNGRRTEWKIAGLRRAIKHGLERPTLLEKAAEVRVGRGSMRPGREKIEK